MKKTWELKIVEQGKVTYSHVSDEWDIVEGSLIFLQQDRDKNGFFIIEERFDGKRIEVLLVNGDEHIPVDDATVFHLFLRAEYKMKQKAVDELLKREHQSDEYTQLQDKFEYAELILRKFEEMVPHGLKKL